MNNENQKQVLDPEKDKLIKGNPSVAGRNNIPLLFIVFGILLFLGIGGYLLNQFNLIPTLAPPQKASTAETKEVNALTFYHWWTSASEASALNAIVAEFSKLYPDTAVMAAPVTGGAGFKMFPIIKSLVSNAQAPDAFQMHAAYEAKPYFDADLLAPIDYIWESEGLEKVIAPVIQNMNKFGDHYYSVPVNVHRANLVWYNKPLLDANGIDPENLSTWEAFFEAADRLKANGTTYPIGLGEGWTAAQVFESIIASNGIDVYEDWINGKITSSGDSRLSNSFEIYKKYLSYVNPKHSDLTWDTVIKQIIKGETVFTVMGDWANGEFKLVGMQYGKDYGSFPVPGTNGIYGLVTDTFQHPKGTTHPTNSDRWLKVVASREGQDAFNPIKGSIPARNDPDLSLYDTYQKEAIADFTSAQSMYPSVTHGSGAPESFKLKLIEVVTSFSSSLNSLEAASSLTDFTVGHLGEYTKTWNLK